MTNRGLQILTGASTGALLAFNALGWTNNYFESISWYDEVSHFLTPAAISLYLGMFLQPRLRQQMDTRGVLFASFIACATITLSVLWEMVEWVGYRFLVPDLVFMDLDDTITDLILDAAGSTIGAIIATYGGISARVRTGKALPSRDGREDRYTGFSFPRAS